jgi:hypothetical protein
LEASEGNGRGGYSPFFKSMTFEKLHLAFMALGGGHGIECSQISTFVRRRICFP